MKYEEMLEGLEQLMICIDQHWEDVEVDSYGVWINQGWNGPGKFFELNYYMEGENLIQLDKQEVKVQVGDVLLVPDHIKNSFCMEGSFKLYYVAFQFKKKALNDRLRQIYTSFSFENKGLSIPSMENSFSTLISELHLQRYPSFMLKQFFMQILSKLYQSIYLDHLSPATSSKIKQESMVQEIMKYLNENYDRKVSLHDLSSTYHVDGRYLNYLFKNVTGKPIKQFLLKIRLDQVKRLLVTTNLSITDIALETGYYDAAHFCRAFKESEGVSPTEYRSSYKRKELSEKG